VRLWPDTIIWINFAVRCCAIGPDDVAGRNGQGPAVIAIDVRQVDTPSGEDKSQILRYRPAQSKVIDQHAMGIAQ
jgi:hypothetical protein